MLEASSHCEVKCIMFSATQIGYVKTATSERRFSSIDNVG